MLCARPRSANLPMAKGADCGIAFHAGGRAGEQDRAVLLRQHSPRRLLRDQEPRRRSTASAFSTSAGRARSAPRGCESLRCRSRSPARRIGRRARRKAFNIGASARVAGKHLRAGLFRQRLEILGAARRERHLYSLDGQRSCQRRAQPGAGADNQRIVEAW